MTQRAWTRRLAPDRSQALRRAVQAGFLLLNLWIGAQFYLFVRYFERGGWRVDRPPGVEGWLPIAGLMNTSYFLQTGRMPEIHPAAMILFVTFLSICVMFRKAFCGWLCPIGTISEYLWKTGRSTFRRVFFPPRWLDIPLRGLKYALLALFLWAVGAMSAESIRVFLSGPYGLMADVKMLDFFRHMSVLAAVVIGILALGSIFVPNLWCRYLCPYGALMGLAALLSPLRIRRRAELCIDCAKCAKACPSNLPVDRLVQIRSAECMACLECVAVCPAEGALAMTATPTRRVGPQAFATAVVLVFVVAVGAAKVSGHWRTTLSDSVYQRLIPMARMFSHP
jgi:polyferredoxin